MMPDSAFASEPMAPLPDSPQAADPFLELIGDQSVPTPEPAAVLPFVAPGDFIQTYGLRENPFPDSVQPTYFFRTEAHADAFRSMMLSAEFKTSLGMVTGPSGTGKTLVSQMLLQNLETSKFQPVLVLVTPAISKTGLLREILAELQLPLPVGFAHVQDLFRQLSNYIMELHDQGRRLVLIIDEAHFLSTDCLHLIRTISNIETPTEKLSTCLLFGEARLAQRLEHPTYESLRNRIYLRTALEPLSVDETAQYVKFRLMTGGRLDDLFTPAALQAVHARSGGIPRSINKVAMLSLFQGALSQNPIIDEAIVQVAAKRL